MRLGLKDDSEGSQGGATGGAEAIGAMLLKNDAQIHAISIATPPSARSRRHGDVQPASRAAIAIGRR